MGICKIYRFLDTFIRLVEKKQLHDKIRIKTNLEVVEEILEDKGDMI